VTEGSEVVLFAGTYGRGIYSIRLNDAQRQGGVLLKPIAPSHLNAIHLTHYSPTYATLTWRDNSNNETGFKIYRSSSNTPIIVPANTTIKTITGLTPNTSYTYTVKAYNSAGESAGTRKTFRTLMAKPTAPSNLNTSHITTNSATLTWQDKSNNETGFKIYRSSSNTPIIVPANTTIKTITGLTPNTSYTYTVKAYNSAGESAGTRKTFRTLMAKPTAPSNLNTSHITTNSATLTWQDKSNNETGFKIYRSSSNTPIIVPANTTSKTITGLTPNTSYTYIVKAYNSAGQSVGTRKTFKTQANTTTIPTIALNTNTNGTWDTHTASTHRHGRYAKFYTFRLTHSTKVTIDLTSSKDTYLFLLQGNSKNGTKITHNDDGGAGLNSRITRTLAAGTYTIEATTYRPATGAFVLRVSR